MNQKNLEIGIELEAISECVMKTTGDKALIIGKKYPIIAFTEDEDNADEMAVVIIDEQQEEHLFGITKLENYFKL